MDARQNQREYWNSVAEGKEFTTPLNAERFSAFVPRTARVLDVGCGYGRILAQLSGLGYANLIGIDFSPALIARGKALYPGLDLRVQEERRIDFPGKSMDAVILFGVLTCICADSEQACLVSEIARLLRPGGILHVSDFLLNTDARNVARYERYQAAHGTRGGIWGESGGEAGDGTPACGAWGCFALEEGALLRHHDPAYLERLFAAFTPLLFETSTYTTMNGNRSNGFSYFGRKPSV